MTTDLSSNPADRFLRGLACAALSPGLRSILVFDVTTASLRAITSIVARMLQAATGQSVVTVPLGGWESDDLLWSCPMLGSDAGGESSLVRRVGPLTGVPGDPWPRLVVLPDLSRLDLAVARSCVMLLGAGIAHLERHGQKERWSPNFCWLASCPSGAVGRVSPHLLDRFALRLTGPTLRPAGRVPEILAALAEGEAEAQSSGIADDPHLADLLRRLPDASRRCPEVTTEAVGHVLDYVPAAATSGPRREIALARLARAVAQLDGAGRMTVDHVDAAARLIGLRPIERTPEESREPILIEMPQQADDLPPRDPAFQPEELPRRPDLVAPEFAADAEGLQVHEPDTIEEFSSAPLPTPSTPYPEDRHPVERETASLRFPMMHPNAARSDRGLVIGVRRATSLHDPAIVSTLLEAAKFQRERRKNRRTAPGRLLLSPTDLRSYRRTPIEQRLLVLLVDFTCLRGCDWHATLKPFFWWAYAERAGICLIRVGAASTDPLTELRAERITVHNLLVPRFFDALAVGPGRATPLAHGLDLTLQMLGEPARLGNGTLRHVQFVVLSDGRGNVPLKDSQEMRPPRAVAREGVEDALRVAASLRGLKGLKTTLLNPGPRYHPELPLTLARELGATIVAIPLRKSGEI